MTKNKLNFSSIKTGDTVQYYVDEEGCISSIKDDFFNLESFKVLAIAKNEEGRFNFVCLYNTNRYATTKISSGSIQNYMQDYDYSDVKYIDDIEQYNNKYFRLIPQRYIVNIISAGPDGCFCGVCREFYQYAVPNQPDNKTLICYSCRQNPLRAYY